MLVLPAGSVMMCVCFIRQAFIDEVRFSVYVYEGTCEMPSSWGLKPVGPNGLCWPSDSCLTQPMTSSPLLSKHTHLYLLLLHLLTPASVFSPLLNSLTPQTSVLSLLPCAPTLAFPSAPSALRLIVFVLTGRCHSGADLWAVKILPCQERLSPLRIQMQTHTHAHTHRVRCTHATTPAHTCWSSSEFIWPNI